MNREPVPRTHLVGRSRHRAVRAWTSAKALLWLLFTDARLRGVPPRLKSRARPNPALAGRIGPNSALVALVLTPNIA